MTFSHILSLAISLFAVLNPVGVSAVYLTMTKDANPAEKKKIPLKFFVAIILITFISIWIGHLFLQLFGITLPDFQIAGGIVLLLLGLNMINPKTNQEKIHNTVNTKKPNISTIAIVPMAIPIGAGPGYIAILIEASERYYTLTQKLYLSGMAVVVCIIGSIIVLFAPTIGRKLGETGIQTLSRIVGLVVASIGAGMLMRALSTLFPGLH